jgi:hypothetical protein
MRLLGCITVQRSAGKDRSRTAVVYDVEADQKRAAEVPTGKLTRAQVARGGSAALWDASSSAPG